MRLFGPLSLAALALAGCTTTPTKEEAAAEKKLHEAAGAGEHTLERSGVTDPSIHDSGGAGPLTPPKSDFYIDL